MLHRQLRSSWPFLFLLASSSCFGNPEEVTATGGSSDSSGTSDTTAATLPTTASNTSSPTGVVDDTSSTGGGLDCCNVHAQESCDDPAIATCVCDQEAFCCAFEWDEGCVALAEQCGGCGAATTDDPTNGSEDTGGNPVCCTPTMEPGCAEDPGVEECVCTIDPFCCEMQWDQKCVGTAEAQCGTTCDGPGPGNDCCTAAGAPGCTEPRVETCVCALDPYCCDTEWDQICIAEAQYECRDDCGLPPPGGDCCMPHDGPECDDAMVTECVCAIDNNCCLFPWNDDCIATAVTQCNQECEGFVPPDPCCSPQMGAGCGDMALEGCVCAIDPFCCDMQWDGMCVGIAQADCGLGCFPPGMGDCCMANGSPGCEVPDVQDCVCAFDAFCCETEWDGQCVDEANADCGGCMGPAGTGGSDTGMM